MKIAILSDIHGNASALMEVLNIAKAEGVDKLLVLGDIVGYYYEPNRVLDLLSHWDYDLVRGNHEDILQSIIEDSANIEEINKKYGSAHSQALHQLTGDQLKFLMNLPEQKQIDVDGLSIIMCHGSPWDHNQYLYPNTDTSVLEQCNVPGIDYVFVGHSHYQFEYNTSNTKLINVGSVGQSRKQGGIANWVLLDTKAKEISMKGTRYDVEKVINQVMANDPHHPYLIDILKRN